ncbi:MAG: ATP/GTP-binding protein, partial [Thermoplasmatales archaeon]|nr:ATP/GTP-binding protein [Thermoplasmatales archaeon]
INILSKSDLLSDKELSIIKKWSNNPDDLYGAVITEEASIYREMNEGILHLIQEFGGYTKLIPTSKDDFFGIDDIYTDIQLQFEGGEDLMKD